MLCLDQWCDSPREQQDNGCRFAFDSSLNMAKIQDLAAVGGFGVQSANRHTRSVIALCRAQNGLNEKDNSETLPEGELNCKPR